MKRILVIIALLISLCSASAEIKRFKTELFNAKVLNGEWGGWQKSNVVLVWDNVRDKITIYSTDIQYISYNQLEIKKFNESTIFSGKFINHHKEVGQLTITILNNGDIYMSLTYQDAQLLYKIYDIDVK
jgi:hypothetical protein